MLNDLLGYMGSSVTPVDELNPYFLGSIVLIKDNTAPSEVVDGQQRLTTLTILLAAIRASVPSALEQHLTVYLYEKGSPFTGTPDRYRLTLRDRDANFFRDYIQVSGGLNLLSNLNSTLLTDSQRNIVQNARLYLDKLANLPNDQVERLAKFILTRCFLIVVSTPDLASAFRIFMVLNDRGMDLSVTDILKADVIGNIPYAEQDAYTHKWESAEESLGRKPFEELFAHIRTIRLKVKQKETILEEFRKSILTKQIPQQFIDDIVIPYAEAYRVIKEADYSSTGQADTVNRLFDWLNRIDNFDWMPSALAYFVLNSSNPTNLITFLTGLERLAAGLMILRADVNARLNRYADVLSSIESGTASQTTYPLNLTSSECAGIRHSLAGDLYNQPRFRTYVLLRLDEYLAGAGATYNYKVISVEHVLPQNPPLNSQWLTLFPDLQQREQYVHKLGNLVLLSKQKNSQAQNYDFGRKKQLYFLGKNGVSPFVLTTQVLNESDWTPTVIDQRQLQLLQTLSTIWNL